MWMIFALENLFFALHVFAGLTLFSVAWLYFDAWKALKANREIWKILGFIILGISFLIRGMEMRDIEILQNLDIYIRTFGYLLLVIGLIVDPLQPRPKVDRPMDGKSRALILLSFPIINHNYS